MNKLFIYYFIILLPLFSFAGKIPPPQKDLIVSYKDKPDRSVGFISFDNLSDNTNHDYLKTEIPRTIALQLKNKKYIHISSNHLFPDVQYGIYAKKVFSNYISRISVRTNKIYLKSISNLLDETNFLKRIGSFSTNSSNFSNALLQYTRITNDIIPAATASNREPVSNQPFYIYTNITTNVSKRTNEYYYDVLTNSGFVTAKTNIITNRKKTYTSYTAYLYKSNINYISPAVSNFSSTVLSNYHYVMTNKLYAEYPGVYILEEHSNFIRKFKIDNRIYTGSNYFLERMLSEIKADYVIYGSFKTGHFNQIFLEVYLVNKRLNSVENIFRKNIRPAFLTEEIAVIPKIILAAIRRQQLVTNITFTSTPSGAYVYIDNNFIGNTPLTMEAYPEGVYDIRLWLPDGEMDLTNTLPVLHDTQAGVVTNSNLIVSRKKNRFNLEKIIFNSSLSGCDFKFKQITETGFYSLKITNKMKGDIYINSTLIKPQTNFVRGELKCGSYFLNISGSNIKTRRIELPVRQDKMTVVTTALYDKSSRSLTYQKIFNHKRNSIIWGGLGLTAAVIAGISYPRYDAFGSWYYPSLVSSITAFTFSAGSLLLHFIPSSRRYKILDAIWNYKRNTRIFGAGAVTFLTLSVYNLFKAAEYKDKYTAMFLEDDTDLSFNEYVQGSEYEDHRRAGYSCVALSAASMTMAIVFRILDVKSRVIDVDFFRDHDDDIQFSFSAKKEF